MHIAIIINSLKSFNLIFNSSLSVAIIAINSTRIAIENLKKSSVVASIPFCVNVLTNMPLEPNSIPAKIGKIRYILLEILFSFVFIVFNIYFCGYKNYLF